MGLIQSDNLIKQKDNNMLKFFACFTCDQKSQSHKSQNVPPVSALKYQIKQEIQPKKNINQEPKLTKKASLDSEYQMPSTNATNMQTQEAQQESDTLRFVNRLQLMEVEERLPIQAEYVKKNCFARGPKYVVERSWSIQYTDFLKKKSSSLRKVDNTKIITEDGRIATEFEYSKNYSIVSKKVWILIKTLYGGGPQLQRDRSLPIKELPVFGLTNHRYSCYMNSGLQAIFSIPQFADYFYNECFIKIKHKTKYPQKIVSLITSKFLKGISIYPDNFYDLGSLKKYIQSKYSQKYQHNCQEFIRYYISRLQQELNPRPIKREDKQKKLTQDQILDQYDLTHTSIVDSLFHGELSSYIRCGNCQNISIAHDPIMQITLEMSDRSLELCLQSYFSIENLVDYYECQRCLKRCKATRQFYFEKAPNYLMITVKRFLENQKKNENDLRYPVELSLNQYFKKVPLTPVGYTLQSVIIHKGDGTRGHYYLITKREGQWYEINDDKVKRVAIEDHWESQAYILIYKLK